MLFLHNTSHVEDEPYPTLLQDKGFGGFPSLAFMDAEGEVLTQPSGRDVADFESTLASLLAWQALAKKADRSADEEVALFLCELELGLLELDDAKARYASLDAMSAEQRAIADNELLLLEVAAIQKAAGRDRGKIAEANATIAEMARAGRIPTGPRAMRFWGAVMSYASTEEDADLFEMAVDAARAAYGDDPAAAGYLERLDKRLEVLKSGEEK